MLIFFILGYCGKRLLLFLLLLQLHVVPLFGDMQISLIEYIKRCPHFDAAKWSCASENAEEKIGMTQYNLTGGWFHLPTLFVLLTSSFYCLSVLKTPYRIIITNHAKTCQIGCIIFINVPVNFVHCWHCLSYFGFSMYISKQ